MQRPRCNNDIESAQIVLREAMIDALEQQIRCPNSETSKQRTLEIKILKHERRPREKTIEINHSGPSHEFTLQLSAVRPQMGDISDNDFVLTNVIPLINRAANRMTGKNIFTSSDKLKIMIMAANITIFNKDFDVVRRPHLCMAAAGEGWGQQVCIATPNDVSSNFITEFQAESLEHIASLLFPNKTDQPLVLRFENFHERKVAGTKKPVLALRLVSAYQSWKLPPPATPAVMISQIRSLKTLLEGHGFHDAENIITNLIG